MNEAKPANVVEALLCVMRALPAIGKDEKASAAQGGYSYRGIEAITAHTQPLFGTYGVLFVPRVVRWEIRDIVVNGKPWTDTIEEVEYDIYGPGGPQDKIVVGPVLAIGRDNADKGGNKCLTQAFKYALIQALSISDTKDDGDHGGPEADARSEPPAFDPARIMREAWARTRMAIERGVPKEVAGAITKALGADLQTVEGSVAAAEAVEAFEAAGVVPEGYVTPQEPPQQPTEDPESTDSLADRLDGLSFAEKDRGRSAALARIAEMARTAEWDDDAVKAVLGSKKRDIAKALATIPAEDLVRAEEMLTAAYEDSKESE